MADIQILPPPILSAAELVTAQRQTAPSGDELTALVRFDIADSCKRLGLPCAAKAVATAVSTTDWQDIQTELSQTNVCGERNAMIRAVYAMSVGRVDDAVGMLAWFRGHSNHEWFVEVRGERAAKGGA